MIPKSTSMLEEIFESKFWSFTGAYPIIDKWNAWLDGNGISKKTWGEVGLEYFKNQESDVVYIKNPSARLFGKEPTRAMENMMAMLSFQSPDNVWVKKYFGSGLQDKEKI